MKDILETIKKPENFEAWPRMLKEAYLTGVKNALEAVRQAVKNK